MIWISAGVGVVSLLSGIVCFLILATTTKFIDGRNDIGILAIPLFLVSIGCLAIIPAISAIVTLTSKE